MKSAIRDERELLSGGSDGDEADRRREMDLEQFPPERGVPEAEVAGRIARHEGLFIRGKGEAENGVGRGQPAHDGATALDVDGGDGAVGESHGTQESGTRERNGGNRARGDHGLLAGSQGEQRWP